MADTTNSEVEAAQLRGRGYGRGGYGNGGYGRGGYGNGNGGYGGYGNGIGGYGGRYGRNYGGYGGGGGWYWSLNRVIWYSFNNCE